MFGCGELHLSMKQACANCITWFPDSHTCPLWSCPLAETFVRADGAFIPFAEDFNMNNVTTSVKGVGEIGDVHIIDLQSPINSLIGRQVVKVGRSSGLTTGTIMAYALEYNDEKGICFLLLERTSSHLILKVIVEASFSWQVKMVIDRSQLGSFGVGQLIEVGWSLKLANHQKIGLVELISAAFLISLNLISSQQKKGFKVCVLELVAFSCYTESIGKVALLYKYTRKLRKSNL